MKSSTYIQRLLGYVALGLLFITLYQPIVAVSSAEVPDLSINDAAMQLVQFCLDPKAGFDEHAVATLVEHVLSPKQSKESPLSKSQGATGAYYEFDTRTAFPRFIEYS